MIMIMMIIIIIRLIINMMTIKWLLYFYNLFQTIQDHTVTNKFHSVCNTLSHYSVHIDLYISFRSIETNLCHTLWNKKYLSDITMSIFFNVFLNMTYSNKNNTFFMKSLHVHQIKDRRHISIQPKIPNNK